MKALLRDIVSNKKITPENYIMAKAYLSDGTRWSGIIIFIISDIQKPSKQQNYDNSFYFSLCFSGSLEENKLPKLGLQSFPEKQYVILSDFVFCHSAQNRFLKALLC